MRASRCLVSRLVWGFAIVSAAHGAETNTHHWAFRPLARVEPPSVRDDARVATPVDRFLFAALAAHGSQPAPPADKERLLRRVSYDLVGLPPTVAEIDAFVNDASPGAFTNLIERLLASPRYGERWARHWLDLARYAESDGFEHDAVRPHAWQYRDYVIRAFNEDRPYDRFIREQLAGDELWPDSPMALTATAFNLLGPDMVDSADQVQRRLNTLNDATDTAASVFLGLTLGCARCHNHKFEPLTQRDYFSLQAFFASAVFERERLIPSPAERAAHEIAVAEHRKLTGPQQKQIDDIESPHRQRLWEEKMARLSEDAQAAHRTPPAQRTVEQENTVQETVGMLKITEAELLKAIKPDEMARRKTLLNQLKKVPKPEPLPATMALRNTNGLPPQTFILLRGDYNSPGEEVQPGFPAVLGREDAASVTAPSRRRSALADWITSPANPLTARVMVNRIWQHHFGRGLVSTPSDFGTRGERPTHPELLDWLAGEFARSGWSVKAMHRLILASAVYQQSSRDGSGNRSSVAAYDAFPPRRLTGEELRDSLLLISGRLNAKAGGPGVSPPIPADIIKTSKNWSTSPDPADHNRRSIYVFTRRNLRFPFFEAFDAPDSNLTCPIRGQTTTAPQSLTLLNSDDVMAAAKALAARLAKFPEPERRITEAYRAALGRRPSERELAHARAFLATSPPSEFCRALFNLNAFVYVE